MRFRILKIICIFIGMADQNDDLFLASDFTERGSFTSEIEGAATDIDGNVYAVSFEYKETIGIAHGLSTNL